MQGDNLPDLINYSPKMLEKMKTIRIIADVNSDLQNQGLQAMVTYDRATAARFNIAPQLIDDTLYDAFGQRQVSTMYTCAEPVPRGDGGGAAVLAGPAVPAARFM